MKKYNLEYWVAYIQGTLGEEEQLEMEELLLQSEEAMEQYLLAMDGLEGELPEPEDHDAFTDRMMQQLYGKPVQHSPKDRVQPRSKYWYEHPMFHYSIAASITFILLISGVFQNLSGGSHALLDQPSGSFTDSIIQKAFSWLDALK
ncbi:hypothetical protein [Paenibacillus terrigena]|uniref:hypothetical protein n=1 Tax=Paenibacillus terrigena TaxID=369333 RepID=UPI00036F7AE8|nr:hypothetical protein [Paenibacillus terrigena]